MKIFDIIDDFRANKESWESAGGRPGMYTYGLTGKMFMECKPLELGFPKPEWISGNAPFRPAITTQSNGAYFIAGPEATTGKDNICYVSSQHTCYDWMMRQLIFVREQYGVEFEIGIGQSVHVVYKENMTPTELSLVIWPAIKTAMQFQS